MVLQRLNYKEVGKFKEGQITFPTEPLSEEEMSKLEKAFSNFEGVVKQKKLMIFYYNSYEYQCYKIFNKVIRVSKILIENTSPVETNFYAL